MSFTRYCILKEIYFNQLVFFDTIREFLRSLHRRIGERLLFFPLQRQIAHYWKPVGTSGGNILPGDTVVVQGTG